jgi:hypothetical protein
MTDDLVKRLRDSSRYDSKLLMREAAADRIEELEKVLQAIAGIAVIPATPPTKIGAETDTIWGCLVMCTFMARGVMGELDEQ